MILVVRFKVLDLLLGFVLRDAVGLLDLARELITLAGNHVEVIVGELAPLRFNLAFELLPVAFHDIPIHIHLLEFGPPTGGIANRAFFVAIGLSPCVLLELQR